MMIDIYLLLARTGDSRITLTVDSSGRREASHSESESVRGEVDVSLPSAPRCGCTSGK